MRAFNDIEKEFERFEKEIESIPNPPNANQANQVRPQQGKSSAFIPPQLRARLGLGPTQPGIGRPPPPPPPPPPVSMPAYAVGYAHHTVSVSSFMPVSVGKPMIRPNVVIEAKPIRYDASDNSSATPAQSFTESAPKVPEPSDALKRAKAVLDAFKLKTEASASIDGVPISTPTSSHLPGNAANSCNAGSNIPLPLNAPVYMQQSGAGTSASSSMSKKAAKAASSQASESEVFNGVRKAGGEVWTDMTLFEWDTNDHRMFCGDLGNETTDDTLAKVFSVYPSFSKAKVIRDKRTNKTRGFGFVSFKDAQDLARAIREMNGKYVGNRPIKLRKSAWKDRNVDIVKKKEKARKRLGLPL